MRLMMRSLLGQRFRPAVHFEMKEKSESNMVIACDRVVSEFFILKCTKSEYGQDCRWVADTGLGFQQNLIDIETFRSSTDYKL